MVKNARCTLCLTDNKRAINVYNTVLQYFYENLANIKVSAGMCWMCYICHARLRQCHRVQQLAKETRGLINVACENKMETQLETFQSLLHLKTSEIKIVCNSNFPLCIKEEPGKWTEHININEIEHDRFRANTFGHKCDEKTTIKKCTDLDDDVPLVNVACLSKLSSTENQHKAEMKHVKGNLKPNIKKYDPQILMKNTIKEEYIENMEEPTSAPCINSQSIEYVEIKIEKGEEMEDEGIIEGAKQESIVINYEGQHQATEAQTDCNERPFKCNVCSKTFKRRAYLNSHSKTHTGYKPFSCHTCPMTFARKVWLQNHILTHTGEKPFSCELCEKKFSQKSSLQLHIKIHKGEKPFSCEYCPMKFLQRGHLRHHIRGHRGEKPYSCDLCPKRFAQKLSLKYHARTHTNISND